MSSFVKQITDSIEQRLAVVVPDFIKSAHQWSIASNNSKTNVKNFRINPGSGSSVEGSLRTITISQQFKIYLTTNYVNKNGDDTNLQAAMELLYSSLDKISTEAMLKRFQSSRINNVTGIELLEPEIDQDNHIVSVGASYTIIYRME